MVTQRRFNPGVWRIALVLILGSCAGAAMADPPDRVARLSYLRGNVSFQPTGDDQWAEASLNRPLGTGDKLYTDKDSRAELEIGSATIRLDQSSSFSLLNLDDNAAQIELTQGVVNLHVARVSDGQSYEIDTPTLAFVISRPGDYRIDIAPQGDSTMVSVVNGAGDVYGEDNASYSVRSGNTYKFNDSALRDYEVLDLPQRDDFDTWVASRNQRYERAVSRQYVSDDVIGYADLDEYGGWRDEPSYGHVWYPTTVEADWAPYRSGHWSWIDPWGWSWVDSAAWGFAPFHYGRWSYIGNRWGWCPGERGPRSVYAPALVGFVGGGGWGSGISVGIGGGPVGWFPLGPREVYVPWYSASRSYFTNVNVRNTTFVNNTYITNVYNDYSRGRPIANGNYAYRNNLAAVTAVPRDAFTGSRAVGGARVRVDQDNLRNATVVSRVGINPVQASFAGSAGRARGAPPAAALDRRVIARTAPPAAAAPIASRIQAIERNGAQPINRDQSRQIATRATNGPAAAANRAAPASRVQVVGRGNTAAPQPLPSRAAGASRGNAPGPIANDRAAPNAGRGPTAAPTPGAAAPGSARGPINVPGRTPATAAPSANARSQPGATGDRNALPSSRFAPRANNPAAANGQGNPPATRNGSSPVAAPNRSNGPAATRSPATPSAPTLRNGGADNAPTRSAPTQRYTPQGNAQPAAPARAQPSQARPATQRAPSQPVQTRPAPQERAAPAQQRSAPAYQPRSAPQTQQRTAPQPVPQQRQAPQAQPRSAPQPMQQQRSMPQPQQQQQRAAPPPRAQPQQRAAPQERKDSNKDDDNRRNR